MAEEKRHVKSTGAGEHRHGTLRAAVKPTEAKRSVPAADEPDAALPGAAQAAEDAGAKAVKLAARAAKAAKDAKRELS